MWVCTTDRPCSSTLGREQVAEPSTLADDRLRLVPEELSRDRLGRELDNWAANSALYRQRGWLLLAQDLDELTVDVGFLAPVAFGDRHLDVMTACIRLRYDNYDLWPPSLRFIDPRTGGLTMPPVQAVDRVGGDSDEVRNALLGHPTEGVPFLCLPGIREYHSHPQHSGDDWLLHRERGDGRLAVICDRVWRRMVRNVLGIQVNLASIRGLGTQLNINLAQGDADLISPAVPVDGMAEASLKQPT